MSRILDKSFRYVPASKTDIRKTFARIRAEQKEKAAKPKNLHQLRKANGQ